MAKKRTNVIPIIEDARHPTMYRMLVGMELERTFRSSPDFYSEGAARCDLFHEEWVTNSILDLQRIYTGGCF